MYFLWLIAFVMVTMIQHQFYGLFNNKYLRMYVCMYVCMYVRMYVCMYVRLYVFYVCIYVCMYVCMYVRTHIRMREGVKTQRHAHMPYLWVVSGFRCNVRSLLFCNVTQRTVVALVMSYPRVGAKSICPRPLKTGPIGCPETSVTYYQCALNNIAEQRRPHILTSSVSFAVMWRVEK